MTQLHQVLYSDQISRFRPLGSFGKPAYESHVQFRAMLMARHFRDLADCFATPVRHNDTGEMAWYSVVPGPVRTGEQAVQTFTDAEWDECIEKIQRIDSQSAALRAALQNQDGEGSRAFASVFEQTRMVPHSFDYLRMVGVQPVFCFWGFSDVNGATKDALALTYIKLRERPKVPEIVENKPDLQISRPWWKFWQAQERLPKLRQGSELVITAEECRIGDLGVLQGDWQLGHGRIQVTSGDKVVGEERCVFSFGRDGRGEQRLLERTRGGTAVPDLTSAMSAKWVGAQLLIETPDVFDIDGSMWENAATIICEIDSNGDTRCYWSSRDGDKSEALLFRLS